MSLVITWVKALFIDINFSSNATNSTNPVVPRPGHLFVLEKEPAFSSVVRGTDIKPRSTRNRSLSGFAPVHVDEPLIWHPGVNLAVLL